jgi:adenylate cyclase
LPYDVVFLLNSSLAALAEAVEKCGGYYSNFTGDGLMALFGLNRERAEGAKAALRCALTMFETLDNLNDRLAGELERPFAIGIGIHTGEAIVGRMGPPKTPILSAIGDSVNTTARLESATRELGVPLVVSVETLHAAGDTNVDAAGRGLVARTHGHDGCGCARRGKPASDSDLIV